jgi:hypothetical protein
VHNHFSPRKDLARNSQSGVIYLANKGRFDQRTAAARLEEMERAIVRYFVSRDEDSTRILPRIVMPIRRRPGRLLQFFNRPYRRNKPRIQPLPARRSHRTGFY